MAIKRYAPVRAPEPGQPMGPLAQAGGAPTGGTSMKGKRINIMAMVNSGMAESEILSTVKRLQEQGAQLSSFDMQKYDKVAPTIHAQNTKRNSAYGEKKDGFVKGMLNSFKRTLVRPFGEVVATGYEAAGRKAPEWTETQRLASPAIRAFMEKGITPEAKGRMEQLKAAGAEGAGATDVMNALSFMPGAGAAGRVMKGAFPGVARGVGKLKAPMSKFTQGTLSKFKSKMKKSPMMAEGARFTPELAKQEAARVALSRGIKTGAKFGAGYGVAGALDEGATFGEVARAGLTGAALGAVLPVGLRKIGAGAAAVGRGAGALGKGVLGRGAGVGEAGVQKVYQIFSRGTKAERSNYLKVLRAKSPNIEREATETLTQAVSGVRALAKQRQVEYQSALAKIKKTGLTHKDVLKGTRDVSDDVMKNFDLSIGPKGKMDFSKSTIMEGRATIAKAIKDIRTWDDPSSAGLDKLKQRLNSYSNGLKAPGKGEAKMVVDQMKNNLALGLEKGVKGYKEMTRKYGESKNLQNELMQGLGIGSTIKNKNAALTKLNTLFSKSNNEERRRMARVLEEYIGKDFSSKIVAQQMRKVMPIGLVANIQQLPIIAAALATLNPAIMAPLLLTSPRLVSNLVRGIGLSARATIKLRAALEGKLKSTLGSGYSPKILDDFFRAVKSKRAKAVVGGRLVTQRDED